MAQSTLGSTPSLHLGDKREITWLMVGCLGLALALLGRAAWVQLLANPRLEQMSRHQFQSKVLVQPRRGAILDRNGEPLAVNLETSSLAANPLKIQNNRRVLARLLAKATDIPYAKLYQRLGEQKEFVWIKRHLSDAELGKLKNFHLIDGDGDLTNGLWMVKESKRMYPHGELASHVLGDVNIDSDGVEGEELYMNDRLRGKVAAVAAIKDALGRPSFIDAVAARRMKEGEPVTLTLDASLQFSVEEDLKNAIQKTGSKSGTVIVMNAVNGEILAMANAPTFNPGENGVPLERRRNRGVTDGYEPGSIMKPVLAASALSHGWKLTDQVWGEEGKFHFQGKIISEAEAKDKFKWISLKKIIQVSSNIGAAKVALKLGAEKYQSTLRAYGFGSKTAVDFPGEIAGRIPGKKEWTPLTLANTAFGQGLLVTPIQMARAYATFLNGGWLVQPRLLKTLPDGAKPEPPHRVLSDKVAQDVLAALESVTEEGGTGTKARLDGYRVAGKTGTAQMVDPETGHYSRSKHIASFIGFALDVNPKIVILTELEEPKGIYFGGETAAPLFHEILNAVTNRFGIAPTVTTLAAAPTKAQKIAKAKADMIKLTQAMAVPVATSLESAGANPEGTLLWKMPSLKGLSAREALRVLQGHPFKLAVQGSGVIIHQMPEEGKLIGDGELVRLSLGEGP
jgi:cell division protein FtsI (penicillin-binding protein 3)